MNKLTYKNIKTNIDNTTKIVLDQFTIIHDILENNIDDNKIKKINSNEVLIDNYEMNIREEINTSIVLYSPRASDLRKIIAYYDITGYLERIGDLLLNISEFIVKIDYNSNVFRNTLPLLIKMLKLIENMTKNAIFATICKDRSLAHSTILDDNEIDDLNVQIFLSLIKTEDKDKLDSILSINSIASNMERIGDHATNISEAAIYIIEGIDIKHYINKESYLENL